MMSDRGIIHVAIFIAVLAPGFCTKPKECRQINHECDPDYKYRSIDGSCNNLNNPTWAMAETPYDRLLPNRFSDGVKKMPKAVSGNDLPLARKVSVVMNTPENISDTDFTIGFMQYGQFITHDIVRLAILTDFSLPPPTKCCKLPFGGIMGTKGEEFELPTCQPVVPPPDDPIYAPAGLDCGDFPLSATTFDIQCTSPNEVSHPITVATSYADLSSVYGTNETLSESLRAYSKGFLKTDTRENQMWPAGDVGKCPLQAITAPCYKAGDDRINQSPHLAVLQVAYFRYHNIIAKQLADINPHWDDEKLYQEARRINVAMYQHVVYNEYVPRIIGEKYARKNNLKYDGDSCVDDYNKKIDASIILEFATAAFRAPHASIVGNLHLLNNDREVVDSVRISDFIFKPQILEDKTNGKVNYDYLVRGASYQPQDRPDSFNDETKHFFFKGTAEFGLDLRSSDIQRDRDHGMGTYVNARKHCNLSVPKSFKDLRKYMSKKNVDRLESVYESVNDIELTVGGLAEPIADGAKVGETNRCLIKLQFQRTRTGDRFFYDNCEKHKFTKKQLKVIKKATFACLLCDTSEDVHKMQPSAFDLVGKKNKLTSCKKLCNLNLDAWKEKCSSKKCKKDKCKKDN